MKRIIFTFAFMLLILPVLAFSQMSAPKESLRGLRGVFIKVLPVARDAQVDGLSTSQIQKMIESELRKAGVPIRSESQLAQEFASLAITIDTIKHPQGVYLFTVNVAVVQEVQIARPQRQGSFPAETYSKKALGLTTPSRMDLIYEPLKEKLGEFIRDYLAVNPKQ
jgi:stress-induced morphogen